MNCAVEDIVGIVCVIILIMCVIFTIKNENTYRTHIIINEAIFARKMYCIRNADFEHVNEVDYKHAESYGRTLLRFWDWGYKRILPPDKFEIIKPFIK